MNLNLIARTPPWADFEAGRSAFFSDDVAALSNFIGHDLSNWVCPNAKAAGA